MKHNHPHAGPIPAPPACTQDQRRQSRIASMGEMAASIAHEVQQPLAAIALNAQAALRFLEGGQPAQVRDALRALLEASAGATAIVNTIRLLAQTDHAASVSCRLDTALREVLTALNERLNRYRIKVHLQLAPERRSVMADPVQLRQVLLNLLNNAIEALQDQNGRAREIAICSRDDGAGSLIVTIADSGPGLPAGASAQVFDPLFTTKAGGMGVGLSICRSIVRSHGGAIWASADSANGSVFGFRLRHGCEPRPAGPDLAAGEPMAPARRLCEVE